MVFGQVRLLLTLDSDIFCLARMVASTTLRMTVMYEMLRLGGSYRERAMAKVAGMMGGHNAAEWPGFSAAKIREMRRCPPDGDGTTTVSYTHLTLPTKRI